MVVGVVRFTAFTGETVVGSPNLGNSILPGRPRGGAYLNLLQARRAIGGGTRRAATSSAAQSGATGQGPASVPSARRGRAGRSATSATCKKLRCAARADELRIISCCAGTCCAIPKLTVSGVPDLRWLGIGFPLDRPQFPVIQPALLAFRTAIHFHTRAQTEEPAHQLGLQANRAMTRLQVVHFDRCGAIVSPAAKPSPPDRKSRTNRDVMS